MTPVLVFASAISRDGEWTKMGKVMRGEEGMLAAGSPEVVQELPLYLHIYSERHCSTEPEYLSHGASSVS